MLTVIEHKSELYPPRTEENIKLSHLTIAIAVDFSSAGEKLTKKLADKYGRPVVSISPLKPIARQADAVVRVINSISLGLFEHVCINIAGNGIYRLTGTLSQGQCDQFTSGLLEAVANHRELKHAVKAIRTGGQTGFDESGAKAGIRLGIHTTVLLPKGYKIRRENGVDITMSYEEALLRFQAAGNS